MVANLVSLVMDALPAASIERIVAILEIDRDKAEKAISAAVPVLIAGMAGLAEEDEGAARLADAISEQAGGLENFERVVVGGGLSAMIDTGSRVLATLFGGQDYDMLAAAIAGFSGLSRSASLSLIGMLVPVVMGTIAAHMGERLSAESLADFLADQRDHIVAALPQDLIRRLSGSGFLEALGSIGDAASGDQGFAGGAWAQLSRPGSARRASTSFGWLVWAIPALAVAALAWYFAATRDQWIARRQNGAAIERFGAVFSAAELSRRLDDRLTDLQGTLANIADMETARAVCPRRLAAWAQLDHAG